MCDPILGSPHVVFTVQKIEAGAPVVEWHGPFPTFRDAQVWSHHFQQAFRPDVVRLIALSDPTVSLPALDVEQGCDAVLFYAAGCDHEAPVSDTWIVEFGGKPTAVRACAAHADGVNRYLVSVSCDRIVSHSSTR